MSNRTAHRLPRLGAMAMVFLTMLAPSASHAQTMVEVAGNWGLIGTWSVDCSIPASREQSWITYAARNGKLFYEQELGDARTSNQVMLAEVRPEGAIEIVLQFNSVTPPQTRMNLNIKDKAGRYRTLVSKNVDTNEYSIKDGIFTGTGQPSKWLSRCR